MAVGSGFGSDELRSIDYFLDQLARAVESGEVPRESYERLAPRYLERRAELVAWLYPAQPQGAASEVPAARTGATEARSVTAGAVPTAHMPEPSTAVGRAHRERREVNWPTVLTFLGAFLVIVAAAIFAAATWNLLPVMGTFAVMGALTVGFYVAGEFVRRRLGLEVGGVALTVVGSAMLLFDGWIIIDGFDLQGALPWAVLLLAVSGVYAVSEWRWHNGIFGVVSAASQVAWWWLLGQGLGWPMIWRVAAIAAVALLWQIAAERIRGDEGVTSLATVLKYAAPVVAALAALGTIADAAVAPADVGATVSAGVVALSAGVVLYRQTIVPAVVGRISAAVAQLAIVAMLMSTDTTQWWQVVVMAALGVVWLVFAYVEGGAPFVALAVVAEFAAVMGAGEITGPSDAGSIWSIALLAALQFALLAVVRNVSLHLKPRRIKEFDTAELVAGWILLAAAFATGIFVPFGAETPGVTHAVAFATLGVVLAAVVALGAARGTATLLAVVVTVSWSIALIAYSFVPRLADPWLVGIALLPVALALLAVRPLAKVCAASELVVGWFLRSGVALVGAVGLASVFAYEIPGDRPVFLIAGLVVGTVAAATLAADAWRLRGIEPVAVDVDIAVAALLVVAGSVIPGVLYERLGLLVFCAAVAATMLVIFGFGVRIAFDRSAVYSLVASALGPVTVFVFVVGLMNWLGGEPLDTNAAAWLGACAPLVAVAGWVLASQVVGSDWLAVPVALLGVVSLGSLTAQFDPNRWVTVVVFGMYAAGALGVCAWPAFRRDGTRPIVGWAALGSGALAVCALPFMAAWSRILSDAGTGAGWMDIGAHGAAVGFVLIGVYVIAAGVLWRFEDLVVLGPLAFLCALWIELAHGDVSATEYYSLPFAVYLGCVSEYYARRRRLVAVSRVLDVFVVLALIAPSILAAWTAGSEPETWVHSAIAFGLGLCAILAGVVLRVRAYFFGGVAAVAFVAFWRAFAYLSQWWWLVLGLVGVSMLVIALTWELQRRALTSTREQMHRLLGAWR